MGHAIVSGRDHKKLKIKKGGGGLPGPCVPPLRAHKGRFNVPTCVASLAILVVGFDWTRNYFIQLATAYHEDCHFKFLKPK